MTDVLKVVPVVDSRVFVGVVLDHISTILCWTEERCCIHSSSMSYSSWDACVLRWTIIIRYYVIQYTVLYVNQYIFDPKSLLFYS